MKNSAQLSDTWIIAVLLAAVGGYLDAYTYTCRGHVFANAQTGNIVLLGIGFANGDWGKTFYYLLPVFAFFLGIVTAERIKEHYEHSPGIHWRQVLIAVEMLVLGVAALLWQEQYDMAVNTMISFVCSLQVAGFRKMNGSPYATTMCTGNLRSATECLCHYRSTKNKQLLRNSLQYFSVIAFFLVGAVVGTRLSAALGEMSLLFACLALLVVFVLMFRDGGLTSENRVF